MNPVEKDLETVLDETQSLETRIAAGARLWDISNRAKKAIEPLKETLRVQTKRLNPRPGATTIEGEGMTRALVTVPEPTLVVSDYALLKSILGDEIFKELFREHITYTPRPNAADLITHLPPRMQEMVFGVISEVEGTPRVSFQYGGSGISEM